MISDWLALLLSYLYVFTVIGLGEALRRFGSYGTEFTRKFIHIGVGMWAVGTVLLFQRWWFAIVPPLSFIVINYISYRRETFKAMELGQKGNLGTVYFPISFAALIPLLWDSPALLVAGLMPMTWGDAFAAIIGQPYGRHRYRILGRVRSWEGSLTMFAFSLLSVFLALLFLSGFGAAQSLALALIVALIATVVEALSPWGIDNLTVPLVSALVLALLAR